MVESETPKEFMPWAGITAISAVVSPNVHLDKFFYPLSPNVYVMLIGPSGVGKGLPINISKALVEGADCTRVISGRNSIQYVIKELSSTKTEEGKTTPTFADSRGYLVSPEFSDFVIQDPQALIILTDLYDTHYNKVWKNSLKHGGVETLKGVSLTLFGASSPVHLKESIPNNSVGGGFVGRTLMVYGEQRSRINPLTRPPNKVFRVGEYIPYLKTLANLKGRFEWTEKSIRTYEDWYHDLKSKPIDDKTGTIQRLGDNVLKTAMCMSLSHAPELVIRADALEESIDLCQSVVPNTRRIFMGKGASALANPTAMVLNEMLSRPGNKVSRSRLLRKYIGEFDSVDLDKIMESFVNSKSVTVSRECGDYFYKLDPKVVNYYRGQVAESED
jgi:hypothetical protein